jgi:hypothetical protein
MKIERGQALADQSSILGARYSPSVTGLSSGGGVIE